MNKLLTSKDILDAFGINKEGITKATLILEPDKLPTWIIELMPLANNFDKDKLSRS